MQGNYRVSKQRGISRVVLSFVELVRELLTALENKYMINAKKELTENNFGGKSVLKHHSCFQNVRSFTPKIDVRMRVETFCKIYLKIFLRLERGHRVRLKI
jgi:hypothetical protein